MKQSVIKGIFMGAKGNIQSIEAPINKEALAKERKLLDELKKELTQKQFALMQSLLELREQSFKDEVDFYYIEGFKIGVQLGIECKE